MEDVQAREDLDAPRAPSVVDGLLLLGVFEATIRFGPSAPRHWVAIAVLGAVGLFAGIYGRARGYPGPGWDRLGGGATLAMLLVGISIAVLVWAAVAALRLAIGWSHPYVPWWAASSVASAPVGNVVLAVLVAPVVEELVFRGVLYRSLRTRLPVGAAVALTTVAFTVGHASGSVPGALLLGVVAAMAYERTRTLLAPVAVHAASNAAMLLFGLAAHHLAGVPGAAG